MPSTPGTNGGSLVSCIPSFSAIRVEINQPVSDSFLCLAHPNHKRCSNGIDNARFQLAKSFIQPERKRFEMDTVRSITALLICEKHQRRWNKVYKIRVAKRWQSELSIELYEDEEKWHKDPYTLSCVRRPVPPPPEKEDFVYRRPIANTHQSVLGSGSSVGSAYTESTPLTPDDITTPTSMQSNFDHTPVTDEPDESESPTVHKNETPSPGLSGRNVPAFSRLERGVSPDEVVQALSGLASPYDRTPVSNDNEQGNNVSEIAGNQARPSDTQSQSRNRTHGLPSASLYPVNAKPGATGKKDREPVADEESISPTLIPGTDECSHSKIGYRRDPRAINGHVRALLSSSMEEVGVIPNRSGAVIYLAWLISCAMIGLVPELLNIPLRLVLIMLVLGPPIWTNYIYHCARPQSRCYQPRLGGCRNCDCKSMQSKTRPWR